MADLKMVYETDAPIAPLNGKTVAIIGFGSQGHAHGQNLRDSGVKVIVANRKDSANGRLAIEKGFDPMPVAEAVKLADLIIITLPDEVQPEVWNASIAPNLKPTTAIGVTHGFNIQLSAFRDFTQLIVDNAYLFDNIIGLQMHFICIGINGSFGFRFWFFYPVKFSCYPAAGR